MFLKITLLNSILVLTVYPPATTFFFFTISVHPVYWASERFLYVCTAFCSKR